jgi:hypothetical protein
MGIPPAYMHSPPLQSQQDAHETRAAKRRRTNDHDTAAVQLQSFSAVPKQRQFLKKVQSPYLAQIPSHSYSPGRTWTCPQSTDLLPTQVAGADQHGYSKWSISSYQSDHHFADRTLLASHVWPEPSQFGQNGSQTAGKVPNLTGKLIIATSRPVFEGTHSSVYRGTYVNLEVWAISP